MVKNKNLKIALVVFCVLVATGLVFFTLEKNDVINIFSPNRGTSEQKNGINYAPPTDAEINAGNQQKEHAGDNDNTQTNTSTSSAASKKSVRVIITDANQYDNSIEVRSFVPDHYEDGTCTITFTQNSQTVSKTTPAYKDISTTICTNPLFSRSDFPTSGTWNVTVSYETADTKGVSLTQAVEIK